MTLQSMYSCGQLGMNILKPFLNHTMFGGFMSDFIFNCFILNQLSNHQWTLLCKIGFAPETHRKLKSHKMSFVHNFFLSWTIVLIFHTEHGSNTVVLPAKSQNDLPTYWMLWRNKFLHHIKWHHMATEIWVNIGSGNGLLPDGTKPLPEPMLTNHQWSPVSFNIKAISLDMPQP